LTSCKDNKQNDLSKKGYVKPLHINYEFAYLDNINDPNYLVALLDNSSELESERIGIEGKRSDSYPIYKRLCAVASDTSLLRLTNHKNPKIRVYGMWALTSINRQLALTQMKKLINDNCIVVYRTGCTTMAQKVSWLAASRFNSTEVVMLPRNNSKYLDYNIVIK
jgi:hypothetical protein